MKTRIVILGGFVLASMAGWFTHAEAGDNLPLIRSKVETPKTVTLTARQATTALHRDWLFQATGKPLLERAAQEIVWARELARRISKHAGSPDFSGDLLQLTALEQKLKQLQERPPASDKRTEASPGWIWYPEGNPPEHAPVEKRYFRRTFELSGDVQRAHFRVAADDTCEVFVDGVRIGARGGWQRAVPYKIEKHLKRGTNVVAILAENRPAPVVKNPAGLIAHLSVTLVDGTHKTIISDSTWKAENTAHADWKTIAFDDAAWKPAMRAAPLGGGPWGKIAGFGRFDLNSDPLEAYAHVPADVRKCYFDVRQLKRRILLKNPRIDFSQLLLIDQPMPEGPEVIHEAIHRMGIMATAGGRLLVLDGLHPGGKVRQLAPDEPGSFWRPDLSFDGERVLFCYKSQTDASFHLYEMNLDGTGLKQLTDSEYDDIDPIYLPDGHIMFTTTRGNSYVRCGPFIYSYILARCDADGKNVYLVSHNNEPDFVPSLMDDGRVIYSRWEYTDKPLWRVQSLWTVNPDGTHVKVFWGNQSIWPDHVAQPRQIPGSRRVMFCGVGHHDWWSGSVGIIDPQKGLDFPHGLTKVTRDRPWPESGNGPVDPGESEAYHASGEFTGYNAPYPLSEEDFLVSARGLDGRFRLYLMDVDGNRDLIYEGLHNVLHAMPVKARKRPPARSDRVAWPGTGKDRKPAKPGIFFSANIYEGVPDLPHGSAKFLRVVQQDHKTYSTWKKTYRHSGPSVSIVQEEAVKRILGVVPIEKDGSVNFKVPSGKAVFFQLVDEQYRCLQTMRSFTGVMPGEVRGCTGCHETHSAAPEVSLAMPAALKRPPRELTPPPWGTVSIGYERFVQPVLDKHCGECHQGEGDAREEFDLTLRPGHGPFKEPYLTLVGPAGWGSPVKEQPGYGIAGAIPVEMMGMNNPVSIETIRPMKYLSFGSKLIEMSSSGKHYDVKLDSESLRRLIAWVDMSCPYRGDEEIRAIPDPDFPGIERLPIRPRVKTAPIIARP